MVNKEIPFIAIYLPACMFVCMSVYLFINMSAFSFVVIILLQNLNPNKLVGLNLTKYLSITSSSYDPDTYNLFKPSLRCLPNSNVQFLLSCFSKHMYTFFPPTAYGAWLLYPPVSKNLINKILTYFSLQNYIVCSRKLKD